MLDANSAEIKHFLNTQLEELFSEEKINGTFSTQYEHLANFRRHIRKNYTKFSLFGKTFRPKIVKLSSGDIIDHHSISYLAPMTFTRIGWNEKRLLPQEHLKQISDFFLQHNTRFIYVALPNKCSIYPSILPPPRPSENS